MIKKIAFENYKAFKKGEIVIKPLTVLLGANSVGKSSIIQLLLMLQQTAMSSKYKSALRLHGEYVSLGENENIFHNKKTDDGLIFTFQFLDKKLMNSLKGEFLERLTDSFIRPLQILNRINRHSKKNRLSKKQNKIIRKETWSTKEDFLTLAENFFELKKEFQDIKKTNKIFKELIIYEQLGISNIFNQTENEDVSEFLSNLSHLYDLLKKMGDINSNEFELSFKIENIPTNKGDTLKVTQVKLNNHTNCILDLCFKIDKKKEKYESIVLKSDLVNIQNLFAGTVLKELIETVNYDSTLFYLFSNRNKAWPYYEGQKYSSITNIICDIFSNSIQNLKQIFQKEMINYVSPLRAHPKRYYFLDKAKINTFLDTLDGDSLTEILKENYTVKNKVNDWLKRFGLSVNVSTLENVIHKLKVNQNELTLDITDVGFGISQILPVIVQGFLSFENSLTIIEQPEIHLHPKMQADLADLFIDIALSTKEHPTKFLMIETHSEYLLKRLRRRMAEKKNISPDDVAIYFFNPKSKNSDATIEEKKIDQDGAFEWPQNFYSGELLKDTVEFIKNQRY